MNSQATVGSSQGRQFRCFNCNGVGHRAADCRRPRRQPGPCFGSGSREHRLRQCPSGRDAQMMDKCTENIGCVSKKHAFSEKLKFRFEKNNCADEIIVDCLYDSSSPISFVKEKYVSVRVRDYEHPTNLFTEINQSELKILAKTDACVSTDRDEVQIKIYVVPNETMTMPVVLGRDFLEAGKFKLIRDTEKVNKESEAIAEILNISIPTDEETVRSEVNSSLPHHVKRVYDIYQNLCYLNDRKNRRLKAVWN